LALLNVSNQLSIGYHGNLFTTNHDNLNATTLKMAANVHLFLRKTTTFLISAILFNTAIADFFFHCIRYTLWPWFTSVTKKIKSEKIQRNLQGKNLAHSQGNDEVRKGDLSNCGNYFG